MTHTAVLVASYDGEGRGGQVPDDSSMMGEVIQKVTRHDDAYREGYLRWQLGLYRHFPSHTDASDALIMRFLTIHAFNISPSPITLNDIYHEWSVILGNKNYCA